MGRVGRFGGVVIIGRGVGIGCRWGECNDWTGTATVLERLSRGVFRGTVSVLGTPEKLDALRALFLGGSINCLREGWSF